MSARVAVITLGLTSMLPIGQRTADAQAFASPVEFTMIPMSLEWTSVFAADNEATSVAGRMRLQGPVRTVTTQFVLAPQRDADARKPLSIRIEQRFDVLGNLECVHSSDSRSGDRQEHVYLTLYDSVAGVPVASKVISASCSAYGGECSAEFPTFEDVALFTYDADGRLTTSTNSHSSRFRDRRFERGTDGQLQRVVLSADGSERESLNFDAQGRGMFVPFMSLADDKYDAKWTGRAQLDWIDLAEPGGKRAAIWFDRSGTPIGWEVSRLGSGVRYHQSIEYDEHGNWTAIMVDATFTDRDGTRKVGMPAWGFVRQIDYRP